MAISSAAYTTDASPGATSFTDGLDIVEEEFLIPPPAGSHVYKNDAAWICDVHLRRLARREMLGRRVLGELARRLLERRAHHALGFARVSDYTRERLGLSSGYVYEAALVARHLASLPKIASAFERGEIGWTKLRLLAGVGEPATEPIWLALAREYTADALRLITKEFGKARSEARRAEKGGAVSASGGRAVDIASDAMVEGFVRDAAADSLPELARRVVLWLV